MSRRTQNRNQYESTTVGELAAGAFAVTVDSAAGLITDQPIYFVIEPDIPGQREWIRVESITGNQLNIANPNGRDLQGSDGDLTHPAGSKVRSVPTQQIFEDIFSDAEDDELALTQHQTDGGDPHAQAGYLVESQTDLLYVKLAGSTMTGDLILFQDPSVALGAATKQYTDAAEQAAKDASLALTGGTMLGEINMDGNQIFGVPTPINDGDAASKGYVDASRYTDAEAVTAVGAGVLKHNIEHAGTSNGLGTTVTQVIDLTGAGIVDVSRCTVSVNGSNNTARSYESFYNFHTFTTTSISVTITPKDIISSGAFEFLLSIVEYP